MEVPVALAQECMANYSSIMLSGDLGPITAAYTATVSFNTPEFAEWLAKNNYLQTTTQLTIAFGIYTQAAAEQIGKPEYAGRLTTFVWPVTGGEGSKGDGDDKPPFNGGILVP